MATSRTLTTASQQALYAVDSPVTTFPVTLSCWFKPTGGVNGTLVCLGSSDSQGNYFTLGYNPGNYLFAESSGSTYFIGYHFISSIEDGQWHHLAAVIGHDVDGSNPGGYITVYLDGVADSPTGMFDAVGPDLLDLVVVGAEWGAHRSGTPIVSGISMGSFVNGSINHVSIFDYPLSPTEVLSLATGNTEDTLSPVRLWKIHGVADPEPDSEAVSSLTLYNSPASGLDHAPIYDHGVEFVKTGRGVMGAIGSNYPRQNTGVTSLVAFGNDVTTYNETGLAVSARTASGAKQVTYSDSGIGITAFTGSGSRLQGSLFIKTGIGVLGVPYVGKTGIAQSTFTGSGADVVSKIVAKTGSGITAFSASGTDTTVITYSKSGGGAGGTGTPTYGLISLSHPVGVTARGADVFAVSETGIGISARTGSAAKSWQTSRTGIGVLTATGSGASDRLLSIAKTGGAVSAFQASGGRSTNANKTGTGITSFVSSGAKVVGVHNQKTGIAISTKIASGTKNLQAVKSGIGISARTGGGLVELSSLTGNTYFKTGAGIMVTQPQGRPIMLYNRSNIGITVFNGSGSKIHQTSSINIYTKSGIAVSTFTGSIARYEASGVVAIIIPGVKKYTVEPQDYKWTILVDDEELELIH